MTEKLKVINLWGGPNTGKSTTAAGLFYVMKIQGFDAELVTEYAKTMVFEKRANILRDQLYILAKQNRCLERLRDMKWAITDSPIPMGVTYALPDYYDSLKTIAFEAWNSYDNLNFYLTSSNPLPFQIEGRVQNETEAELQNNKILNFLIENKINFQTIKIIPHVENPFENHIMDILSYINK